MAKKTNKYWDDRALRRLSDAEQLSEDYIKRVKKIYDKAFKDINKENANIKSTIKQNEKMIQKNEQKPKQKGTKCQPN